MSDTHGAAAMPPLPSPPLPHPSADSAASESSPLTIRPSRLDLHRHALESVCAFLDRDELLRAMRVSKAWRASVRSMRALSLLRVDRPLTAAEANGAAARHLTAVGAARAPAIEFSAEDLCILAEGTPQLRELHCAVLLHSLDERRPLRFPSALRSLHLAATGRAAGAALDDALDAAAQLAKLESLHVCLPSTASSSSSSSAPWTAASFSPLLSLVRLRRLAVEQCAANGGSLSDEQLDDLRCLPHLRNLQLRGVQSQALRRLLLPLLHEDEDEAGSEGQDSADSPPLRPITPPFPLSSLQSLSLRDCMLHDDAAALLPSLPALTSIEAAVSPSCRRFDWLVQMQALREVHFTLHLDSPAATAALLDGLGRCSALLSLHLHECGTQRLTEAGLASLLRRLPLLQSLDLRGGHAESLSFLSPQPESSELQSQSSFSLADSLTDLKLCDYRWLPPVELRCVDSLRGLRRLTLYGCFTQRIDDDALSHYRPPSTRLPLLQHFDYC